MPGALFIILFGRDQTEDHSGCRRQLSLRTFVAVHVNLFSSLEWKNYIFFLSQWHVCENLAWQCYVLWEED